MIGGIADRTLVHSALLATAVATIACHRALPSDGTSVVPVRIDRPSISSLHSGDSIVLIINDREAWRGVYAPHARSGGLRATLDRLVPGTDSVVSAQLWTGPDVAARYHVGGRRPGAIIVVTAPPPE